MSSTYIKVPLVTVVLVGLFVWVGEIVTGVAGSRAAAGTLAEGVSVENGELLFWGKGKCHTCHSVGTRGNRIRCPNLGQSGQDASIGMRAIARARERSEETGQAYTPGEYLVESIVDPSAHVVEGFKDEMPKVYEPPINLKPDELTSVLLYLQSLGATPDPGEIRLPPEVRIAAGRANETTPWEPYLQGDTANGRALFFDVESAAACAKCHRVGEIGGEVGPDLTELAGTRTAPFVVESILQPDAQIASGFELVLIQMRDGRLVDGIIDSETQDTMRLVTKNGDVLAIPRSEIARQKTQETSMMPGNFAEFLTVEELHDLLALLMTLQ